jgi:hypothetical protein
MNKVKHNLSSIFKDNEINISDCFNDIGNVYDENLLMHIGEPKKKYKF